MMRREELLDLYSDYLLYSKGQITATGLSEVLEGEISHDKIIRFLSTEFFDEKTLWKKIKKLVRTYENENAILIFDDTIVFYTKCALMYTKHEP